MSDNNKVKFFKHFSDQNTVQQLLREISGRHKDYNQCIESATQQIKDYFYNQFPNESNPKPSRFNKNDSPAVRSRFLIALSGGIDSTVATYLAVKALGKDRVLPITMPARPDDYDCIKLSSLVREQLGYQKDDHGIPYLINIEPIIKAHMTVMNGFDLHNLKLGESYFESTEEQKFRSGNFGSRVRIGVLYDLQRAVRGRILGTCNRTEYCQGYNTKFGTPISYDLGILNDLYKSEVYELGKLLGVPKEVMEIPPSTGYFEGQTHEGELGATVEEQDIFCYLLFEKKMDPMSIATQYGASEQFAKVMQHRYKISDHKRHLNIKQDQVKLWDFKDE